MTTRTIAETTVHVHLDGTHRLIERSLDRAYKDALYEFGIDEYAHSDKVEEWERSSCCIEVEFEKLIFSGGYVGGGTTVVYKARCEKTEDEEYD